MDERTMSAVTTDDGRSMPETLEMLDSILMQARANIGDPGALAAILDKLGGLIADDLPRLAAMGAGPDEKAQMVRLQTQIVELERLLQTRESILTGFSRYLKEMVEG
jgi:hypothetical protein